MSEAYECDRCDSLHPNSPDTNVQVFEGEPRHGPQDGDDYLHTEGMRIKDAVFDLCPGCRNDLRRWFAEAGGEVSFPHSDDAELADGGDA